MLAGGMSREAVIISTVTTLALGMAGMASDPTAARTLKRFVRLNGPTGETLPNQQAISILPPPPPPPPPRKKKKGKKKRKLDPTSPKTNKTAKANRNYLLVAQKHSFRKRGWKGGGGGCTQ